MSERRVVITGLGAIAPNGNNVEEFWKASLEGQSGIDTITGFDPTDFSCKIAGEVKNFDPADFMDNRDMRRADRYTHLAFAAAAEAYADARIEEAPPLDMDRAGCLIGSGIGGLSTLEAQNKVLNDRGPGRVSPFLIPMMISNMASGMISMKYGFRGPNFAIVTACASSTQCIGEGWRLIRDDDADILLAGGSEAAATPLGIAGFASMKAVSTRNDEPQKASRPFDIGRDGFVMGEGGGILVLEELEHAKKRGAKIYAELVGYGASADAHHMTAPAPEGEGGARAMKQAMKRAKLNADEVSYVNAHGTSTPQGDVCETQAIKSVLGDSAKSTPVSSTKSMIGHLLGAAGAVEMVACVKAIENNIVPPTINIEEQDPKCDLDYVPDTAREMEVDVVANNSFGFGGHNACIIARKFK